MGERKPNLKANLKTAYTRPAQLVHSNTRRRMTLREGLRVDYSSEEKKMGEEREDLSETVTEKRGSNQCIDID